MILYIKNDETTEAPQFHQIGNEQTGLKPHTQNLNLHPKRMITRLNQGVKISFFAIGLFLMLGAMGGCDAGLMPFGDAVALSSFGLALFGISIKL